MKALVRQGFLLESMAQLKTALAGNQGLSHHFDESEGGPVPMLEHTQDPHVYLVGWPSLAIIKVGYTTRASRYSSYLTHGGRLIHRQRYVSVPDAQSAESSLLRRLSERYDRGFQSRRAAEPYLRTTGAGYTETYSVPLAEWDSVAGLLVKAA